MVPKGRPASIATHIIFEYGARTGILRLMLQ